jgi:hypothetical protein
MLCWEGARQVGGLGGAGDRGTQAQSPELVRMFFDKLIELGCIFPK